MKSARFNILFVVLFVIGGSLKASEPRKTRIFAAENRHTVISTGNSHFSRNIKFASMPNVNSIKPALLIPGISGNVLCKKAPGFFQKLYRSNLKLSFRISHSFNLLISYT